MKYFVQQKGIFGRPDEEPQAIGWHLSTQMVGMQFLSSFKKFFNTFYLPNLIEIEILELNLESF